VSIQEEEQFMRNIRTAFIAMAALGTAALTASAANAQSAMSHYGPHGGSSYSYGADRANPSIAPNGWDRDNPRDQQLQGTR
jgi:Spy/CpxP family protein refolding chaperone